MNRGIIQRLLMITLLCMLFAPFSAQASTYTVSEVEESLMCYACTGESLNKCRSGCGDQMRSIIKNMKRQGKSKDEVLDYFVKQHGVTILTIPQKKGFNLVAYNAPIIGLLVGIGIAFFLVRKWGKNAISETGSGETQEESLSSDMQKKIDDELSKLEEDD